MYKSSQQHDSNPTTRARAEDFRGSLPIGRVVPPNQPKRLLLVTVLDGFLASYLKNAGIQPVVDILILNLKECQGALKRGVTQSTQAKSQHVPHKQLG